MRGGAWEKYPLSQCLEYDTIEKNAEGGRPECGKEITMENM